jgi:hypothetical protein
LDSALSDDGAFTTTALVNINFHLFLATLCGRFSFFLFDVVKNDGFFIEDVRVSFTCSFSNEPLYKKGRRFLDRYIFKVFYETNHPQCALAGLPYYICYFILSTFPGLAKTVEP